MIRIRLPETRTHEDLDALALTLGNKLSDTAFRLLPHLGKGTIKLYEIEEGVHIYSINCTFYDQMEILHPVSAKGHSYYTLSYYPNPETFEVKHEQALEWNVNKRWNMIFCSGNTPVTLRARPNVPLRCFAISFSMDWINANIKVADNEPDSELWQSVRVYAPLLLLEAMTRHEQELVFDVYQNDFWELPGLLFLRSRALTMISDFLMRTSYAKINKPLVLHHMTEVDSVEKKLMACIEGTLPSIKELAHEVFLSESTLQREFKKAYGKAIYDYYLEKKMDHAMLLISAKSVNITDIASRLGYENTSQFIAMFKKYFGKSPGALHREVA
jgi:AraC-like DNA-binding protein